MSHPLPQVLAAFRLVQLIPLVEHAYPVRCELGGVCTIVIYGAYVHVLKVRTMAVVTVRVPEETKREMEKLKHVNWSEVMRKAITEEVRRKRMRSAARRIEELRAKSKIKWDSVSVIREWRERRR